MSMAGKKMHSHTFPDLFVRTSCNQLQEDTKQAAARGDAAVTPLAELELMPYLDEDGMITKVDTTGVKASVYAVYDEVSNKHYRETDDTENRDCRAAGDLIAAIGVISGVEW